MKQKILFFYYTLLGKLAHQYINKHKPYIIGINGSVGKTSCRMIISQTLHHYFPHLNISTSAKNFNGELGLSLSIFEIDSWNPNPFEFIKVLALAARKTLFGKKIYDIILLEYGIDRPKEMEFLLTIAKPHIGIFTAIDAVHSEQFGNPAEIAKEEVKMIKHTREIAFLNENDIYAMQLHKQIEIDSFIYQTADNKSNADIQIHTTNYTLDHELPSSEVHLNIKGKEIHITTNLFGKANFGYIGVALVIKDIVGAKFGYTPKEEKKISLHYTLQPGRFSIFEGIEETTLFDSSYNASPLSMRSIIDTVRNIKQTLYPKRELWLVLGDMRELGDHTEKEHRLLAGYVSQVADRVFLVGEHMTHDLADELEKFGYDIHNIYKFYCAKSLGTILKKMLKDTGKSPLIIFKGSQNTIFLEEAVKLLLKHPDDRHLLPRQSARRQNKKSC